jgi:hypothetical protein
MTAPDWADADDIDALARRAADGERDALFTPRWSSEWAIRPFIARHPVLAEIADASALRGYDAVYLASLGAGPGETILVTWDRDLSSVAVDAGLAVAPRLSSRDRRRTPATKEAGSGTWDRPPASHRRPRGPSPAQARLSQRR